MVKKLRIQSFEVDVIQADPSDWASGNMGRCDVMRQKIVINSSLPKDTKDSTLLHEVIHYLSDSFHLELDEAQVCSLETGLFDFIKTNKGFIKSLC